MRYFRYPLNEFSASDKKFELTIGGSFFSLDEMRLNLMHGEDPVTARMNFKDIYPWPVKLLSPGVMGWYAFVPGMECYHGILSMDHTIEGLSNCTVTDKGMFRRGMAGFLRVAVEGAARWRR